MGEGRGEGGLDTSSGKSGMALNRSWPGAPFDHRAGSPGCLAARTNGLEGQRANGSTPRRIRTGGLRAEPSEGPRGGGGRGLESRQRGKKGWLAAGDVPTAGGVGPSHASRGRSAGSPHA